MTMEEKTSPDLAALYRLSGDWNPLHIDQEFASLAGFSDPILHGLATYGIGVKHVTKAFANGDPKLIKSMKVSLLMPGEKCILFLLGCKEVQQLCVSLKNMISCLSAQSFQLKITFTTVLLLKHNALSSVPSFRSLCSPSADTGILSLLEPWRNVFISVTVKLRLHLITALKTLEMQTAHQASGSHWRRLRLLLGLNYCHHSSWILWEITMSWVDHVTEVLQLHSLVSLMKSSRFFGTVINGLSADF